MSLLPSIPDISTEAEPRVVGLDSEEADELLTALSSETARHGLSELHEEPAPPGELAERVDTSLQNAQYHLSKLEDAGIVEVVGTAYSEKGREMSVYGPADSPLVIFASEKERAPGLKSAISRLFGGFLILGIVAAAVQVAFGDGLVDDAADEPTREDDVGAFGAPEEAPEADADTPAEAADGIEAMVEALLAGGLPPGLAFFLGGAIVLTVVVTFPYIRARLRARR